MITVNRLKELLAKIPDEAEVNAYEGEDIGLSIELVIKDGDVPSKFWWIRAKPNSLPDIYTEGFE